MSDLEELDLSDVAPGAMDRNEAAEQDYRWTVLCWAEEGKGKSHFAHTMPEPVMYIDTEGKAHNIAHKFDKLIKYWQPNNYDEAVDSLQQALNALRYFHDEQGVVGTIVIDSMSIMWDWAQQKYVDEYYPGKDADEVNFTSSFGGGQSDWKKIKDFHNNQFRSEMINSPFHLCWTAMSGDDYEAAIEDGVKVKKATGEKHNVYKVNNVIHIYEDEDTIPHGELDKSDLTKWRFSGLKRPTFEKMESVINTLSEAEVERQKTDDEINVSEMLEYDIKEITEGNPRLKRAK